MSRWFRFYADVVNDPKVQRLAPDRFKAWVNLLCLAAQNDGHLPPEPDIAFALRITAAKVASLLNYMNDAGLLDRTETGWQPHNWPSRQFKSDVSNERVKRWRERKCNVTGTVTETPPDTETEADTEQSKKKEGGAEAPVPEVTPPPVEQPAKEKTDARGTRLPADWQPDPEAQTYATRLGLDCRRVAEDFRDYWLGKAGAAARKVDWSSTWRRWCRESADRLQRAVPAAAGRSRGGVGHNLVEAAELAARHMRNRQAASGGYPPGFADGIEAADSGEIVGEAHGLLGPLVYR